jgi:outer membrane protein insertion porin family
MLYLKKILSICCVTIIFTFLSFSVLVRADTVFSSITVIGNQRVETATILSFADMQLNTSLSDAEINNSLQRITSSKLFESIEFKIVNNSLSILVTEYPTINKISMEGNKSLTDEQLLELISSKPLKVFSNSQATSDADRLAEAYSSLGRISAEVVPQIIRRSENRVDLVFEIFEGPVIEVARLSFVGNRNFSDRRLRRVLQTKQAGLLRRFRSNDTFSEDRIELDKQLLSDFYSARGYIDFKILSSTSALTRQRDGFFVSFKIDEGYPYRLGELSVSSTLAEVDTEGFLDVLNLQSGLTFSPTYIDEAISRAERLASEKGLNFIRVDPVIDRNDNSRTLDIVFQLTRGKRIFVERIDITGNTTTIDRIIRNQFKTVEGDPFNPRNIREASARINALGFFEPISVNTKAGSDESKIVIDVKVKEVPTGSLTFGASYGQSTGFGGNVKISQRNFLGRGQRLSFSLDSSTNSRTYSLGFGEPNFLSNALSFDIDVFNTITNNQFSDYDTTSYGISPSITFPVSMNGKISISYTFGGKGLINLSSGSSKVIQDEKTTKSSSVIGIDYEYDTRRSGYNPDAGVKFKLGQEYAGFGAANKYLKTDASVGGIMEAFNGDLTLIAELEAGKLLSLSDSSSILNRYFGSEALRGFQYKGFGPRDVSAQNNDALGGNLFVASRFEAAFPIGFLEGYGMSGGAFYDLASVWGLDNTTGSAGTVDDGFSLRSSIGLSLFWKTVVGPLRINYSKALSKKSYDKTQMLELSVSTQF